MTTKIEWTEETWNPVSGCSALSPGCTNCYAMTLANRLAAMGQSKYQGTTFMSGGRAKWNGVVKMHRETLDKPRQWNRGKLIFVNSMSDLFHEPVPFHYIEEVFEVMNETPQHTYQVLTKRSERLETLAPKLRWSPNIWMGVSVENADYTHRVGHLCRTPAMTKFLSLEPLLGPLDSLDLKGIDWVIVGGESGARARPMSLDWARSIRDQCINGKVPFHLKQVGGRNKKKAGRHLDGRTWDEFPERFANIPREDDSVNIKPQQY